MPTDEKQEKKLCSAKVRIQRPDGTTKSVLCWLIEGHPGAHFSRFSGSKVWWGRIRRILTPLGAAEFDFLD